MKLNESFAGRLHNRGKRRPAKDSFNFIPYSGTDKKNKLLEGSFSVFLEPFNARFLGSVKAKTHQNLMDQLMVRVLVCPGHDFRPPLVLICVLHTKT